MWPGTANSDGWRSPQASAGTPNNTRELAQIDKKKPQLITAVSYTHLDVYKRQLVGIAKKYNLALRVSDLGEIEEIR